MTVITIHMRKNDGLEKKIFFFVVSHPGGSVSLPRMQESGCISGRLPDDPGGFTCMKVLLNYVTITVSVVYPCVICKNLDLSSYNFMEIIYVNDKLDGSED